MNSVRWLFVASAWLAPALAYGGDWAYWRGPETNGISREKNLVSDWSLETGKNVLALILVGIEEALHELYLFFLLLLLLELRFGHHMAQSTISLHAVVVSFE